MTIAITVEGLHPTSVACLEMLQGLEAGPRRMLDLGCGSGILGAFVLAQWPMAELVAADISAQAVEDTKALLEAQGVLARARVFRSDGLGAPEIAALGPYDLIVCNLLAEPLLSMAPMMRQICAQGGTLMLSGILAWMAPQVEAAYREAGFNSLAQAAREPWRSYVMRAV